METGCYAVDTNSHYNTVRMELNRICLFWIWMLAQVHGYGLSSACSA